MSPFIHIIGMGADGPAGLRPEQLQCIREAEFLAGGRRHLEYFPQATGERFVIRDNLVLLIDELARRHPRQHCVVLASGDPLFYGIGANILRVLGPAQVRIEPSLSSMQLAFARAGLSWHDARVASIHGRDLRPNLLPLLGKPKIGLFTEDGHCPARVAAFFAKFGLAEQYRAVVGERLGAADERISVWKDLTPIANQKFANLNVLILQRSREHESQESERLRALVPGVPDDRFNRGADGSMMTRQEVRAVLLAKLSGLLRAGDTVWDIGAGLGTVSIEVAVLRPDVEVLAVECDPHRARFLRQNCERFDTCNVRIIEGTAPQALAPETESPRLIFLGGSGEQFQAILSGIDQKLQDGGRLLANFVTLEHLVDAYRRFHNLGWHCSVTEMALARSDRLGERLGLKPQRTVWILAADKPGARR